MNRRDSGKAPPKPIRRDRIVRLGFTRQPYDEPLTPGLRRKEMANPIGFTARIVCDEDEK